MWKNIILFVEEHYSFPKGQIIFIEIPFLQVVDHKATFSHA